MYMLFIVYALIIFATSEVASSSENEPSGDRISSDDKKNLECEGGGDDRIDE